MQADILQSVAFTWVFKLYLTDHITPATGKTVAITLSKNTAAFGNPSVGASNATEIASGWYFFTTSTTDTGTLGPLICLGTCTGCDNADQAYQVIKATNGGRTGIPDAVAGANGGLPILSSSATTLAYTVTTVTTVTNQLTAAQVATGVWQDTTSGDFTVSSSIGKSLYTSGNAPGAASGLSLVGSIMTLAATPPTAAAIATAVWTDTTAGDFTTLTSPGKIIFAQLGGAFTTTSSSVFSTAALANGGGTAPTAVQNATAVWQSLLASSDFSTALSIGALLKLDVDAAISTRSTYAGGPVDSVTNNVGGNVTGSVASVSAPVTVGTYSVGQDPATLTLGALQADWLDTSTIGLSIAMAAGLAPVAGQSMSFPMKLLDDSLAPNLASVTAMRITDSAAPVSCTNAVTEIGDGKYTITLSVADLTFTNDVMFVFSATGCKETLRQLITV